MKAMSTVIVQPIYTRRITELLKAHFYPPKRFFLILSKFMEKNNLRQELSTVASFYLDFSANANDTSVQEI